MNATERFCFFFFQAEDGIRDKLVTGVQTCALPICPGTVASLTLPQQPGRSFSGTVARTAGAIDMTSRTLRIEVDFDNRDGQILPGAYGLIDLAVPVSHPRVSVQVSALLFRPEGVQ